MFALHFQHVVMCLSRSNSWFDYKSRVWKLRGGFHFKIITEVIYPSGNPVTKTGIPNPTESSKLFQLNEMLLRIVQ